MSTAVLPEIEVSGVDTEITTEITNDTRTEVVSYILDNYQAAIEAADGRLLMSINTDAMRFDYVDSTSSMRVFTKPDTL